MTHMPNQSRRSYHTFMWAAMVASGIVLLTAHEAGWGPPSLTTVAAVLFVLCAAACLWTVLVGRQSARDVNRAVEQLKVARREQQRRVR